MDRKIWNEIYDSIFEKEGTTLIQASLVKWTDVNAINYYGPKMMVCAAKCGNIEVIEFLVQNGVDASIADDYGDKPLHIAAWHGYKDIVKFFLDSGIHIECRDWDGNTILHKVCARGHLDLVKYLVINKCDINAKNSEGWTPLISAVIFNNYEIVQYLVESGADVYCRDQEGLGILHYYCFWGGTQGILNYLIQKGCDPNVQNDSFDTPMHCAVQCGNLKRTEQLLKEGADFYLENMYGETPFSLFIRSPFCLVGIELFLEKGAYFRSDDYNFIIDEPSLKEGILQNVKRCTQCVINKFNHVDLPKLYEIPEVAQFLPAIEKMKIASNSKRKQDIAESVYYEIQTNGYCNVLNVRPIVLYSLCVRSLIQHIGN